MNKKTLVIALMLAFQNSVFAVELQSATHGETRSSAAGKDVSIEISPSAWVLQTAARSTNPRLLQCADAASSPWRNIAPGEDEFNPLAGGDDAYLKIAECGLAMNQIASSLAGKMVLPLAGSPAALKIVEKRADSAFSAAQKEVEIAAARRFKIDLSSTASAALKIHFGSYVCIVDAMNGLKIQQGGRPWFDEQTASGRRLTARQTANVNSSNEQRLGVQ